VFGGEGGVPEKGAFFEKKLKEVALVNYLIGTDLY
jgi:hypothetical protein